MKGDDVTRHSVHGKSKEYFQTSVRTDRFFLVDCEKSVETWRVLLAFSEHLKHNVGEFVWLY